MNRPKASQVPSYEGSRTSARQHRWLLILLPHCCVCDLDSPFLCRAATSACRANASLSYIHERLLIFLPHCRNCKLGLSGCIPGSHISWCFLLKVLQHSVATKLIPASNSTHTILPSLRPPTSFVWLEKAILYTLHACDTQASSNALVSVGTESPTSSFF